MFKWLNFEKERSRKRAKLLREKENLLNLLAINEAETAEIEAENKGSGDSREKIFEEIHAGKVY